MSKERAEHVPSIALPAAQPDRLRRTCIESDRSSRKESAANVPGHACRSCSRLFSPGQLKYLTVPNAREHRRATGVVAPAHRSFSDP